MKVGITDACRGDMGVNFYTTFITCHKKFGD